MSNTKLPVDATIAAANRTNELQAETEQLRAKLAEHATLFAYVKEREDFMSKLLVGLGYHLPAGTQGTVEGIVDAVANMALALDAHNDASTPAFDEIARLCGCPEWEYPGQVIRDVESVVKQRDGLQTELRDVILVRDKLQADTVWLRSAWEAEISKNNELRSALRVAEAVRDDARTASAIALEARRAWKDQANISGPEVCRLEARVDELTKQKDGAYAERDRCVAGLAALAVRLGWSVWLGKHPSDEKWDDDWRTIVFINLPFGQVSWHIHDSEVAWFSFLHEIPERPWDGHTTEQKYERLALLGRGRVEPYNAEPCLAHTFVGDVCRDCGLVAPRHVDGMRFEVESEHDQYDRATSDIGRPVDINFVRDAKALGKSMEQVGMGPEDIVVHTQVCGCSEKYRELAPGVHARYCPLAGRPT